MEIPEISIPEIHIPDVQVPYTPHYLHIAKPPDIDVPGCTYQHRDIKNTGNRNLLLEDPNGEYSMVTNLSCPKCNSFVEVFLPRNAYD